MENRLKNTWPVQPLVSIYLLVTSCSMFNPRLLKDAADEKQRVRKLILEWNAVSFFAIYMTSTIQIWRKKQKTILISICAIVFALSPFILDSFTLFSSWGNLGAVTSSALRMINGRMLTYIIVLPCSYSFYICRSLWPLCMYNMMLTAHPL